VELRFDSPDAMQQAFASEQAKPVKADEPRFLGHGTGYAIAAAQFARPAEDGTKLIVIIRRHKDAAVSALESYAEALPGCVHVIHDDVVDVMARPEMAQGPQHADTFLHLYFDSVTHARSAGEHLVMQTPEELAFSVFRVRTATVV
jgi:hypothetical protein